MKILVVSQYFDPENFRVNDIVLSLTQQGHEVTVLTGLPNYPTGSIPKRYRFFRNRREKKCGADVRRCWLIGRKPGMLGMALNYLSFVFSSCCKASFMKLDFDLIFVYQLSPVFSIFPAALLKKRSGKKMLTYCCDLWPESLKTYQIREESAVFRFCAKISRMLYQSSDQIVVTSEPFEEYMRKTHGLLPDRLSYLPQHAESLYYEMDLTARDDGCVDFMFLGNIGKMQDLECVVRAAARIRDTPGFLVHLVGDGSNLEDLKRMVERENLENIVLFHGRHPIEEMARFYRMADVCLLTLKGDSFVGKTIPSKLQGYMAAGKPVLGAIDGAAAEVIRDSGCGSCVGASDDAALSLEMLRYIEDFDSIRDCGNRGKQYFKEHFTLDHYMDGLMHKFEELLEG